ncbi:ParB N-terminal domain-containing protein [Actinomadura oligospora]|uniref:ParB N-terminal domain-containing protein n=1 Tax=Actinomadura oligospora TaxID=111804 RepID=UPI0004B4CCE2|nr:ParB N-terminal domain-containing protein [Actinomadura oligospora]
MARGTARWTEPKTTETRPADVSAGPGESEAVRVPIASLQPADSPRLRGVDHEHVLRMAGVDAPLPPILVHRPTMRVIDGMHRLRAAKLRGDTEIEAFFFDGSAAEAFARAVELNIAHGLPLTLTERRAAAARLLAAEPQASDRMVAARTGLSARTVAAVRRSTARIPQSNTRVGADGRARPVSGALGRRLAAQIISDRPEASLREVARTAGISLSTAHDVRRRLREGRDPVPDGGAPQPAEPVRAGAGSRRGGTAPSGGPSAAASTASGPSRPAPPDTPSRPARSAAPDGAAQRPVGPAQVREVLLRLMKDPALRLTDPGRELLRVLNAQALAADDWTGLAEAVPSHAREAVAGLARQSAMAWQRFASALDAD